MPTTDHSDDGQSFTLTVEHRVAIVYALALDYVDEQSWAARADGYAERWPDSADAYRVSSATAKANMIKLREIAAVIDVGDIFESRVADLVAQSARGISAVAS